jgi:pimeloyl-ACP methyl ester carboxylesterase
MPTVEVPGAILSYDVAGSRSDPPIVFIHAGVAVRSMWDPQFDDLSRDHFVVRYDTRGWGESRSENVAWSDFDDLLRLFDAVGLERATLVGCSRGGRIAIDTALAHPDRVSGLVTIGSTPYGMSDDAVPSTELERQMEAEMQLASDAADLEALVRTEVAYWDLGPERGVEDVSPEFLERAIELNTGAAHWDFEGEQRVLEPPAIDRLGELQVPTLVVVGDYDVTEAKIGYDLQLAGIPGAEGVRVPDSAHLPSVEHPERFTALLREFLARKGL